MAFTLPDLPYARNALAPHISEETLNFHYGKHHQAYVTNLNGLVEGTDLAGKSLEEVIKISAADKSKAGVFNNSAQVWNHTFYWNSLKPGGGGKPGGDLAQAMTAEFGSVEACAKQLLDASAKRFGSGWGWLCLKDGKLVVASSSNALNPMVDNMKPLVTIDVWEHAYYLDYQNRRGDYLKGVMDHLINWDFAAQNLKS